MALVESILSVNKESSVPVYQQIANGIITHIRRGTLKPESALPGSRVIPGAWGLEHFGAGIPKGRTGAMPYLQDFMQHAEADGRVAQAIHRAGLRGTTAE